MKKDLLLVIDMQNVYGPGGAWECPKAGRAAENIKKLISGRKDSLDVIFTAFRAPEEPEGTWNDYNREYADINDDPQANDMMDHFREELEEYPLYYKSVYSSLVIPEVRDAVRKAGRVLLSGVVAECCVLFTAVSLIDEGVKVIYLKDAVAGLDDTVEKAVETVLSGLAPLQVVFSTTEEYEEEMGSL